MLPTRSRRTPIRMPPSARPSQLWQNRVASLSQKNCAVAHCRSGAWCTTRFAIGPPHSRRMSTSWSVLTESAKLFIETECFQSDGSLSRRMSSGALELEAAAAEQVGAVGVVMRFDTRGAPRQTRAGREAFCASSFCCFFLSLDISSLSLSPVLPACNNQYEYRVPYTRSPASP